MHELFGITTDSKWKFEYHINKLCKKVSHKPNALARISSYMSFDKRTIIIKTFITSQISYYPLVWMFHSKRLALNASHVGKKSHMELNLPHFDALIVLFCLMT